MTAKKRKLKRGRPRRNGPVRRFVVEIPAPLAVSVLKLCAQRGYSITSLVLRSLEDTIARAGRVTP